MEKDNIIPGQGNDTQRKIAFATSEHSGILFAFVNDLRTQTSLIGATEWDTARNAVILETETNLLMRMVDRINQIRAGEFRYE
jgi:hypothetical protein